MITTTEKLQPMMSSQSVSTKSTAGNTEATPTKCMTSTEYYRQNRKNKLVAYSCPSCDYKTYNSKSALKNHINSHHVKESERPFKCTHAKCGRGFSQKAHLISHMEREHGADTSHLKNKVVDIVYSITLTNKSAKSKKTIARTEYYKKNKSIMGSDVSNKKHEYLPGVYLKNHDIHYDIKVGFIKVERVKIKQNDNILRDEKTPRSDSPKKKILKKPNLIVVVV